MTWWRRGRRLTARRAGQARSSCVTAAWQRNATACRQDRRRCVRLWRLRARAHCRQQARLGSKRKVCTGQAEGRAQDRKTKSRTEEPKKCLCFFRTPPSSCTNTALQRRDDVRCESSVNSCSQVTFQVALLPNIQQQHILRLSCPPSATPPWHPTPSRFSSRALVAAWAWRWRGSCARGRERASSFWVGARPGTRTACRSGAEHLRRRIARHCAGAGRDERGAPTCTRVAAARGRR